MLDSVDAQVAVSLGMPQIDAAIMREWMQPMSRCFPLLLTLVLCVSCASPNRIDLPEVARNSLSIRVFKIQQKYFPETASTADRVTILLYDMPRLTNPNDVAYLESGGKILRIDCLDQTRYYRDLGDGFAIRLTVRNAGKWPDSISVRVKGTTIQAKVVDPDDDMIRIYTSRWKKEPSRIIRIRPNTKVIWLLKDWSSTKSYPPIHRTDIFWETWISRKNSAWAYIAALDLTKDEHQRVNAKMTRDGASLDGDDLILVP